MRARQLASMILMLVCPGVLCGQTTALSAFNPIDPTSSGVHLYGVSVFSGYYTGGVPFGISTPFINTPSPTESSSVVGGAATVGWAKSGKDSSVSALYSLSYVARIRHSDSNTLNHQFSLGWNSKLGRRWSFSAAASGAVADLQQRFFTPTVYGDVVSLPGSYDDFLAAMLDGKYTNAQLASILTGTPVVESAAQTFVYGNRVLSASLSTSLTWAPTGRTSFYAGVFGSRLQSLKTLGGSTQTIGTSSVFLVPQSTAAGATVGWSYSVTPRTHIGANLSSTRSFSRLQVGYALSANVSIARTVSRRWSVNANLGAGTLAFAQQAFPAPHAVQYLGGLGIGYRTRSHALLASYSRSLGDAYGFGSGSTSGVTGAWNWRRPASTWSVSSSFGYQKLDNSTFHSLASWQGNVGLGKALTNHISMSLQYGYLRFPLSVTLFGNNVSGSGVTVSLAWSPSMYR